LKRREEKEENNQKERSKHKRKKEKFKKKLGRMVATVNNFDPKTIARRISEAAIRAGGRGTHSHSLCGPVERKKF
jgi:hypothetical protein